MRPVDIAVPCSISFGKHLVPATISPGLSLSVRHVMSLNCYMIYLNLIRCIVDRCYQTMRIEIYKTKTTHRNPILHQTKPSIRNLYSIKVDSPGLSIGSRADRCALLGLETLHLDFCGVELGSGLWPRLVVADAWLAYGRVRDNERQASEDGLSKGAG